MRYFGFDLKTPGTRDSRSGPVSVALAALFLAAGAALLGTGFQPALAQPVDTIRVAEITLAPGDSAEARRLLRADLGPRSPRWARLQGSAGRGQAAKRFRQVAQLAYPTGARADSMLAFFRKAGTGHPDPQVRAEFLFGGLQVAASTERDGAREQFYQRLMESHEGSRYAKQARRLYAPDSRIEAGKPLPELKLPKLSDPAATVEKSDFEGRTFLVDFWGTWCPPCVRAMPHLHEAYRQHGGEDFTILSVALRDSREAVSEFRANRWEMPWDHAVVPKGSDLQKRLRGRFDIRGLPLAILVGPGGQILHVSRGVGSGEETARAIRKAMAEAGSSGNATSEGATSEGATSGDATSESEGPGL